MVEAMELESRSSSTSSPHKISPQSTNPFKSSSPQKFKRQPLWCDRCHLQCHHLHIKFQPNPPISSNVIRGFFYPPQKFKRPPFWNEATGLSSME
jgi:hypothetical protein